MIARCATCPFWKQHDADPWIRVEDVSQWGLCLKAAGESDGPKHVEALAFAIDRSSYMADLETHKTFGCVLHPMNKAVL